MAFKKFRVDGGAKFRLEDHDPGDTGDYKSKKEGEERLKEGSQVRTALDAVPDDGYA